jgi:hypothetical protein
VLVGLGGITYPDRTRGHRERATARDAPAWVCSGISGRHPGVAAASLRTAVVVGGHRRRRPSGIALGGRPPRRRVSREQTPDPSLVRASTVSFLACLVDSDRVGRIRLLGEPGSRRGATLENRARRDSDQRWCAPVHCDRQRLRQVAGPDDRAWARSDAPRRSTNCGSASAARSASRPIAAVRIAAAGRRPASTVSGGTVVGAGESPHEHHARCRASMGAGPRADRRRFRLGGAAPPPFAAIALASVMAPRYASDPLAARERTQGPAVGGRRALGACCRLFGPQPLRAARRSALCTRASRYRQAGRLSPPACGR